jgi:DNA (cytosine-5)-methyltransferase 1
MSGLVLSLFPGIGLLDMAFEAEGFCVVRGPDLLWGGDVRRFHPPRGCWEGIIGGPPCQAFSTASGGTSRAENLIPEFERCVQDARPHWFVMENVPQAPAPLVAGYQVATALLNNRWLGEEQNRLRRFSFGTYGGAPARWHLHDDQVALENLARAGCVTANGTQWEPGVDTKRGRLRGRSRSSRTRKELARAVRLQGLPPDFSLPSFTVEAAIRAVGNGVPLPMGRAVARAVKAALSLQKEAA